MILPAERRAALTAKAQGYASQIDKAMDYLLSRGISREVAEMFQLGYVPDGEFAGRLSIPYLTPGGVVLIKYRCANLSHHDGFKHVHEKCPKYLYEAGTSTHLFNAQVLIHESDLVVLTEGELDAICVQAYTGIAAVAYPGVTSWKAHPHFRFCFEGVNEIIVIADGDEVGRAEAQRVADSLGMNARVVEMPSGEDANSYMAAHGAPAFQERIAA